MPKEVGHNLQIVKSAMCSLYDNEAMLDISKL